MGVVNDYAVVIAHGEMALTGSLCLPPSALARFRARLDMIFHGVVVAPRARSFGCPQGGAAKRRGVVSCSAVLLSTDICGNAF